MSEPDGSRTMRGRGGTLESGPIRDWAASAIDNSRYLREPGPFDEWTTPAFDNPKYLHRVANAAVFSGLMVLGSSVVLFLLVGIEVALWVTENPLARFVAIIVGGLHVSFLVKTAAQAKGAMADFWRCGNGREPKSYTPERIMLVLGIPDGGHRAFDYFTLLFVVSSPFTPIAVFALFEIFALQSDAVWQQIADVRAAAHQQRATYPRTEEMMFRTSREVVVASARTGVLAAA